MENLGALPVGREGSPYGSVGDGGSQGKCQNMALFVGMPAVFQQAGMYLAGAFGCHFGQGGKFIAGAYGGIFGCLGGCTCTNLLQQ